MNIENFSCQKLEEIYRSSPKSDIEYKQCKEYVLKNIYPLTTGQYCLFVDNKLEILEDDLFTKQYRNRYPNEIKKWFTTSPELLFYKLTCEPSKDYIVDKERKVVNSAIKIKAKYSKYSEFPEKTKKQVRIMLDHIFQIICNRDKDQYMYLLKIIKRMCLGIKNNIAVVLAGLSEGTGKSTLVNFLSECILGYKAVCVGNSSTVERFNSQMFSKYMILFDEAERIFKQNTSQVVSTFKTWITEEYITYEEKNKTAFSSSNHHTIFMTANDTSFNPNAHGRRYLLLDINPEKKGNVQYFNTIHDCFNDDCGNAFYSYLIDEIKVEDKFVADLQMPLTNSKKQEIAERLAKPLIFIKENYLLRNLDIKMKLSELYQEYELSGKYWKCGVRKFFGYIRESPLEQYLTNPQGYPTLKISNSKLREIYEQKNWLTEFDEVESDENDRIENEPNYKLLYEALLKENEELRKNSKGAKINIVEIEEELQKEVEKEEEQEEQEEEQEKEEEQEDEDETVDDEDIAEFLSIVKDL